MATTYIQSSQGTTLLASFMRGLGEIRIAHPANTFALTPASLIALQTIAENQQLLAGNGLDWGSGTGCLAVAAAKIPAVQKVLGLEVSEVNVTVAQKNARSNGVEHKTGFLVSDSYSPVSATDRLVLNTFVGQTDFILANPPASEGDDGFGCRRRVLSGARQFLVRGGRVFLSVSSQYGQCRVEGLCDEVADFTYGGILASTDWVPFDLRRADLLQCLNLYAVEEGRGGLDYVFYDPGANGDARMNARSALARFNSTGESPLMKWQTQLFEFGGMRIERDEAPDRETGQAAGASRRNVTCHLRRHPSAKASRLIMSLCSSQSTRLKQTF
jgi:SAM-dependent methyltransferase